MTRANDIIGYFLIALVAVSPIPFGSNRPFFWTFSGSVVGLAASLYFVSSTLRGSPLRIPLHQVRPYLVLWLALAAWLCIQAIPLGHIFGPFDFQLLAGGTVSSNFLSLAPGSTWLMLIRMTSYALVFLLAVQAGANSRRARILIGSIFWAIVLHAAFALLQLTQLGDTILGFPKTSYFGAATGTFINRNSFATFLAIGLSLGASMLPGILLGQRARNQPLSDSVVWSGFYGAGMFVILVALLATQSRMGLFAGALGLFVVVLLIVRKLPNAAMLMSATTLLALAFSGLALWVFGQGVLERVLDLGGAATGRLDLYKQVLVMIMERPLLGYGGGAFELAYPGFFGPPLGLTMLYDKAHSTYLTLASELGIAGALLPIAIIALVLVQLLRKQLSAADFNAPRLAAIGAIVAAAIHSTADFSLEMQANAYLLTALCGIALASALTSNSQADRLD